MTRPHKTTPTATDTSRPALAESGIFSTTRSSNTANRLPSSSSNPSDLSDLSDSDQEHWPKTILDIDPDAESPNPYKTPLES